MTLSRVATELLVNPGKTLRSCKKSPCIGEKFMASRAANVQHFLSSAKNLDEQTIINYT